MSTEFLDLFANFKKVLFLEILDSHHECASINQLTTTVINAVDGLSDEVYNRVRTIMY